MTCSTSARAGNAWRRARLAIATLLLAGWSWQPPATPPAAPRLDTEIARQVDRAVLGRFGFRGLAPVRRESGEMLAGESRRFEIELRRGEHFLAVGTCDEACGDLDLALADPGDDRFDSDRRPDVFPIVGALATRSARYSVEVEMVECTGRCRFALALLVSPVGAGDAERDRLAEAVRLNTGLIDQAIADLAKRGRELDRIDGFRQPSLGGGSQESFEVAIPRAGWIFVAATCDYGCADLDLRLEDASGAVVSEDQDADPEPQVWMEVPAPATYRVTVRMEHCLDEPCAYAASVMAERASEPSPGALVGRGTCFAVHPAGWVATAAHVVEGANSLRVLFADGSDFAAEVHALDETHDLALLRVSRPTPVYLPLAPAEAATLGRRVFTLGFPAPDLLGKDPKFTDGVIAGVAGGALAAGALQITVPIQPGNSGGPLLTEEGAAIGVVTSVANPDRFRAATGQFPQNVNYAARAELLAELLPEAPDALPPVDRAQAIERARAATCRVEAL